MQVCLACSTVQCMKNELINELNSCADFRSHEIVAK